MGSLGVRRSERRGGIHFFGRMKGYGVSEIPSVRARALFFNYLHCVRACEPVCTRTCARAYVRARVCECIQGGRFARACGCVRPSVRARVVLRVYVRAFFKYVCALVCVCAHVCMCVLVHAGVYAYWCVRAAVHVFVSDTSYVPLRALSCARACGCLSACVRARVHASARVILRQCGPTRAFVSIGALARALARARECSRLC